MSEGRKEGIVLFNNTLNTFYLRLYGVKHMVKDHSDRERGRKEGNVLFNNTLNTFYLRLYGVRHMVKDHTDSEIGNPLLPHGLLFPINSKGSIICTIPQTALHIAQTVTPVVEHWLDREIAQWVHHEGLIRQPIAP